MVPGFRGDWLVGATLAEDVASITLAPCRGYEPNPISIESVIEKALLPG